MRQTRGDPLQTQEVPGLRRDRRHVQGRRPGPAQEREEVIKQVLGFRNNA